MSYPLKILKADGILKNIYHCSDIHIFRSNDRYEEYQEVFNKLYEHIRRDSENSICTILGDSIDFKENTSNDANEFLSKFLRDLSSIVPIMLEISSRLSDSIISVF